VSAACVFLAYCHQTDRMTERQTGRQVKSECYSKVFWNLRLQSRWIGTFSYNERTLRSDIVQVITGFLLPKFCVMILRYVTVTWARGLVVACVCLYLTCMKGNGSDFRPQKPRVYLCNYQGQATAIGKY
jgi:hypothetical protein